MNTISGNTIDMVTNDAQTYGIHLISGATYNVVSGNTTYRCGTGVLNAGGATNYTTGNTDA